MISSKEGPFWTVFFGMLSDYDQASKNIDQKKWKVVKKGTDLSDEKSGTEEVPVEKRSSRRRCRWSLDD